MNGIGKRAHVPKHSYGRCAFGTLDKILHEVSIWTVHRSVLLFILHISIFLYFVHNGTLFYDKYILSDRKRNILMMTVMVFFKKKMLERYRIQNIKRLIQIDIMF